MLSKTMLEQDFLLALALAAEVKVQVEEERSTSSDTVEGAGAAETATAPRASIDRIEVRILKQMSDQQTSKRVKDSGLAQV